MAAAGALRRRGVTARLLVDEASPKVNQNQHMARSRKRYGPRLGFRPCRDKGIECPTFRFRQVGAERSRKPIANGCKPSSGNRGRWAGRSHRWWKGRRSSSPDGSSPIWISNRCGSCPSVVATSDLTEEGGQLPRGGFGLFLRDEMATVGHHAAAHILGIGRERRGHVGDGALVRTERQDRHGEFAPGGQLTVLLCRQGSGAGNRPARRAGRPP